MSHAPSRAHAHPILLACALVAGCAAPTTSDGARHAPAPGLVASIAPPASASAGASTSAEPGGETSAEPHAAASTSPSTAGSTGAIPAPVLPPAPPRTLIDGAAAVLWLPNAQGDLGVSVLIENAGGSAQVVARREELVFVAKNELWVLGSRRMRPAPCARCGAPAAPPDPIDEPVLRSLKSGKTLEPWAKQFQGYQTCDPDTQEASASVRIEGAVGPIVFASVGGTLMGCVAAHPMFGNDAIAFDLDAAGAAVPLAFPKQVAPLQRHAQAALVQGACVLDENETPREYRATGEYDASGALVGVYEYLMSAPYVCGLGPDHYSNVSAERADWLPSALTPYGKLPPWVAAELATAHGKHAFMIAADRVAAAKLEFGKK